MANDLCLLHFTETAHSAAYCGGDRRAVDVSSAGNDLLAAAATPDASSMTLHGLLATEGASVLGMLGNFHLLDGLTKRSTITGTVLAGDSNLFRALGL